MPLNESERSALEDAVALANLIRSRMNSQRTSIALEAFTMTLAGDDPNELMALAWKKLQHAQELMERAGCVERRVNGHAVAALGSR